ncbi:hypothetical protein HanXRQr2_Chr10g0420901 [Helianthus annuus]|uniref:Uncharacterized protein n=1 Tax=Helianthus annuus TaxID=4232 RepID=A0A251TIA0_HELAN|nr:hypothetical protein HanXRQr2_Chr10g0420901 [Helianthus annuus]
MDNLFVIFVNYLGGRFKGGSCGHNRCSICFSSWSIIKTCYGGLITYELLAESCGFLESNL